MGLEAQLGQQTRSSLCLNQLTLATPSNGSRGSPRVAFGAIALAITFLAAGGLWRLEVAEYAGIVRCNSAGAGRVVYQGCILGFSPSLAVAADLGDRAEFECGQIGKSYRQALGGGRT